MKKLSLILSVLLLLSALLLVGCDSDAKDPAKESDTVAATSAETVAETQAETLPETQVETVATVTYTVTVKDQNGDPVVGARVQLCTGDLCKNPVKTNDSGVATFQLEEAVYQAKFTTLPEGYTGDTESYVDFPEGSNDLVLTVTKD